MSVTANLTTNVETITATIVVEDETIIAEINTAARGPAGGGTGSIDSTTASDGTADLDLLNVDTVTATVTGTLTADHIHGNLAGNVYGHIRAGETLAKGDPVYVSGSHGSGSSLIPIVSKADASNAAKMPAIGIMDAGVTIHNNGHMVIVGTITELDTAGLTVNAELYVAAGGGMTATPPTARAQPVARVERANANNGAIIVKVNGLSASDATANTLVRRDAIGGASFVGLNTSTLDSSGITTTGQVEFNGTDAGDSLTFNVVNYFYGTGAASAHRIALGAGTTGDALFGAATAAAARTTLGMTTQFVYATAGETITDANFSTPDHNERATVTTPGDDLELFLPVEANSFYEMAFQIGFSNYGNDGIKARFNLPSLLFAPGNGFGAVTGINPITVVNVNSSGNNIILPTVTTNNTPRAYSGVLVFAVGSTAGNIKFQWSKNSTGASASLLRSQNSWMALRKLGSI